MVDLYKIVETDNYGGDYPDEKFATPYTHDKKCADAVAKAFNDNWAGRRYWKVVQPDYQLQPGFEP